MSCKKKVLEKTVQTSSFADFVPIFIIVQYSQFCLESKMPIT